MSGSSDISGHRGCTRRHEGDTFGEIEYTAIPTKEGWNLRRLSTPEPRGKTIRFLWRAKGWSQLAVDELVEVLYDEADWHEAYLQGTL